MFTKKYRLIPEKKTAYEVQEDSSYEMVVFEGGEIGITRRFDRYNEFIGTLLCCVCDPNLEIFEITKDRYDAIRQGVNDKRRAN